MLRSSIKGLVEFGAEAADEGAPKELVDAYTFPLATLEGASADIPAMQVKRHAATSELLHAYWIKSA